MNITRKRKLKCIVFIVLMVMAAAGLILSALRKNVNLFYSPVQIANGEAEEGRLIRLGGMVVKGSVVRKNDLTVQFKLADLKHSVTVIYRGTLPDLFREGQGVVALGKMCDLGTKPYFSAQEVLAKHDAYYMPPEVKAAVANI